MTDHDEQDQDQQDRFDRRVRALYHDAASTLSPAMQGHLCTMRQARARYRHAGSTLSPAMLGRLRAARRTALTMVESGQRHPHKHRSWSALPVVATVVAVAFAMAIGLRWQLGSETGVAPPEVSEAQSIAEQSVVDEAVVDQAVVDQSVVDQSVADQGNPQSTAVEPVVTAPDAPDSVSMDPQMPDATLADVPPEDEALLMLEEDPDFYLWLGGDEALPASLEPSHDLT